MVVTYNLWVEPQSCKLLNTLYFFPGLFLIILFRSFMVVLGVGCLYCVFRLGFSVDGVWGLWCGGLLGFLSWGSLYNHKIITLGKKWCAKTDFDF